MALAVNPLFKTMVADFYMIGKTIAFDSSYPTGGEALSIADLDLGAEPVLVLIPPKSGYIFEYDYTNHKVLVYVEEAVAAGGPLLEVANTTDLSAITGVRVVAFAVKPE